MTRTKQALFIAGGVVLAFLVGFGWQFARAHSLAGQLERTQRELAFQRMEATLGAATIESQRGGFESARQLTSDFFTRLQASVDQAPAAGQPQLQQILTQRDQVITELSRGDAQSGPMLAELFVRYRTAIGESPEAPPGGAPATAPGPTSAGSPASASGATTTP